MVGVRRVAGFVTLAVLVLCGVGLVPVRAGSDGAVAILKADPYEPAGRPGAGFRITYHWQATPLEADYTVFVHVMDKDGRIVLQDDHEPPTPTSKWQGLVTYARTVPLEQW